MDSIPLRRSRPLPPLPIRRQSSHGIVEFVPIDDILAYKLISINSIQTKSNLVTLPIAPPKLINLSDTFNRNTTLQSNTDPSLIPLPLSPTFSTFPNLIQIPASSSGVLINSPSSVGFGQGSYSSPSSSTSPHKSNRTFPSRRATIPTVFEMSENSFLTAGSGGSQDEIREESKFSKSYNTRRASYDPSHHTTGRNEVGIEGSGGMMTLRGKKLASSTSPTSTRPPLPISNSSSQSNNRIQDDFTTTFPSNLSNNSISTIYSTKSTTSTSPLPPPLTRSISNQLVPPTSNQHPTPSTSHRVLPSASSSSSTSPSKPIGSNSNSNSKPSTSSAPLRTPSTPTVPSSHHHNNTSASSSSRRTEPKLPSAKVKGPPASSHLYWSKTPVGGRVPKGIRAHTATLVDGVIWCFGGCDARGVCFKEVWKFDCESFTWSKPKVTGDIPPPTRAHTATVVDKRIFIIGGGDGPSYFNETYYFDTVSLTWTKPSILGILPSRRRAHTTILHGNHLILFGGGNGVNALNDVHTLNVSKLDKLEWSELEVGGKKPIARGYHTMDLVGNKCLVFGGSDGAECFADVHVLDLETLMWSEIKNDLPNALVFPRLSHTSTLIGSYLFIIGGHDGVNFTSDIVLFNLVNCQWETRTPKGIPPPARGYHTTIINDSRIFILGGFNGQNVFDEMFTLDLGTSAFLPQITNFVFEGLGNDEQVLGDDGREQGNQGR